MGNLQYSPALLISNRVPLMIASCVEKGFPLITGTAFEISEKLSSLRSAELSNPLVVGDISPTVAGRDIEHKLLKVLETLKVSAMFMSSVDGFTDVLLSRFITIMKETPIIENKHNSKLAAIALLKGESYVEASFATIVKECPSYLPFFIAFTNSRLPAKNKILEFL